MAQVVVNGAMVACQHGTTPSALNVTSQSKVMIENLAVATIMDCQKNNIPPFTMCTSMKNPQVASATAATGVLTPQPCTMVTAAVWSSTCPKINVDGKPCLCSDAELFCTLGMAKIKVLNPGQLKGSAK